MDEGGSQGYWNCTELISPSLATSLTSRALISPTKVVSLYVDDHTVPTGLASRISINRRVIGNQSSTETSRSNGPMASRLLYSACSNREMMLLKLRTICNRIQTDLSLGLAYDIFHPEDKVAVGSVAILGQRRKDTCTNAINTSFAIVVCQQCESHLYSRTLETYVCFTGKHGSSGIRQTTNVHNSVVDEKGRPSSVLLMSIFLSISHNASK